MKKRVTHDFETRSQCDLKKAGAYKYSLDPTTRPTCLAFKLHGEAGVYLLPFDVINRSWEHHNDDFKNLWQRLIDEDYEFSSHNSFFEKCIYDNILVRLNKWPKIDPRKRRCTAAKAAACALPRNLQGAGEAMRLAVQKDRLGYSAMMATCKPTKQWVTWDKKGRVTEEPVRFLSPELAPHIFDTLYTYCKIDVRSEEALDDALPDLNAQEQEIWQLNQELNWRGLRIDIPTVRKIVELMAIEDREKRKELDSLTMGLVTKPGAVKSILEFLELEGAKLPNLQKKTIEDKLQDFTLSTDMHRLLQIRQALSLASTKKYQSFLARANEDGRVRDILLYHGASTGRDTGVGIQPQNFPRGIIKVSPGRPYAAVENIVECDPDMLRILYGNSLGILFSSVLRNMIIPSEGCELFVADFSKIEVAVLWWLAGNEPGLKVLRDGLDPYLYMAASNTGRPYESFDEHSPERNLGKAQVLGCGFGMGWEKFQKTAWDIYRLRLTDIQSQAAVKNYRTANKAVPDLWKAYEKAAIGAVEVGTNRSLGQTVEAGNCHFYVRDNFLWVQLPSGRKLAYRDPQIAWRETDYGPQKTLEFWGVNPKTKKWAVERTWGGTLTENIVQAVARDLMMRSIVLLEKAGYRALLTVHDEAICEKEIGRGNLKEFIRILCKSPPWGAGLPIEAKGWVGPRYRK